MLKNIPTETTLPQHVVRHLPLLAVLALSSLLSLTLMFLRVIYSDTIVYTFLVWNLFLAWIPLGCAVALWQLNQWQRRPLLGLATLLSCWLLFFPNAPYIVTDLVHLGYSYGAPIWYDAMLLFSFAWNGIVLGLVSLWIVHRIVEEWFGRTAGWLWVGFTLMASGFGVYLGRFQRWNSWDIVTAPQHLLLDTLDQLLNPMANPRTLAVTLLFAAFLAVAYLMLVVLVNSGRQVQPNRNG